MDTCLGGRTHPATISELADKSREDPKDPNQNLKHWLHVVELARNSQKQYVENRYYERSFIQLARAASIALEKTPTQGGHHTLLTPDQRNDMVLVSLAFFLHQVISPTSVFDIFILPTGFTFAPISCDPKP